jgi:hypothetical protein
MKFKILEVRSYDEYNSLYSIHFKVKYHIKIFGLIGVWRTLGGIKHEWSDSYWEDMRFETEELAATHIEKLCEMKRLKLDRTEVHPRITITCDKL